MMPSSTIMNVPLTSMLVISGGLVIAVPVTPATDTVDVADREVSDVAIKSLNA
jgi:hypothetical protein